jgi:hypothetical protein
MVLTRYKTGQEQAARRGIVGRHEEGSTLKSAIYLAGRAPREQLRDARPGCAKSGNLKRIAGSKPLNGRLLIKSKASGNLKRQLTKMISLAPT